MAVGKISVRRDIIRGSIRRENMRSGDFLFEEISVGKMVCWGIVPEQDRSFCRIFDMLNNGLVGCTAQKMKFSLRIP